MYIECLIKRSDDSDTFVDFEQVRYRFTKNGAGHPHGQEVNSTERKKPRLPLPAETSCDESPPF